MIFNRRLNYKKRDFIQLFSGIVIIILLNIIGSFAFQRFDLTSEKRFTLSKATKDLIKSIDDVVYVKVYLEGDFPASYKRLRNATKEMLDEFRAISKENIQYEFINPSADPDEKRRREIYGQLTKQGLQYTNIEVKESGGKSEKIIFPGAIITYKGKETPLQLLKSQMGAHPEEMINNSIQQLEYEITNSIRKLTLDTKPQIAFIEGHGELTEPEVKDISLSLSEYYDVKRVRIDEKLRALRDFKAIIIAKPDSAFSDKDKFIIDQFIMSGGKVLWLVDALGASMDSLVTNNMTLATVRDIRLDDMLFKYGARINYNLVQDLQSAPIPIVIGYIGNQPQQKLFPWLYFPLLVPSSNHPVVNNLNAVKAEFISTIDTVGSFNIKKTVLLHTSKYTKLVNSPVRISLNLLRDEPKTEQFNKPYQPVAILVEGEFESVFLNRIPPQIEENKEISFKGISPATKMIVVADGDIIKNNIQQSTGKFYPLGYDRYTGEIYGNKNFILNAVNYLCDDSGLITVRSRELKLRLLDNAKLTAERVKWQFINTTLPILLVLLFGVVHYYIRKRKYTA